MTDTAAAPLAYLALRHSGLPWSYVHRGPDGEREVQVSGAFTDLTGYHARDLLLDPLDVLVGTRTAPADAAAAIRLRDWGLPGVVEMRARRVDGTTFWDRMTFSPIDDDGGSAWFVLHRDVTEDRRRAREHAGLVESHRRARRRTALLIDAFDRLAGAADAAAAFDGLAHALVPEMADWAGVFRVATWHDADPDLVSHAGPAAIGGNLAPRVGAVLRDHGDTAYSDGSLTVVPIRAHARALWVLATWSGAPRTDAREDIEMAALLGGRAGFVLEQLESSTSDRARTETIESAVFAPPTSFPGVEITARAGAPLSADAYSAWCDAYPLAGGGAGFVISRVYAVDATGVEAAASARSAIRAFLWRDPSATKALTDATRFAYATTPDPIPSGGQIVTLRPRGDVYDLEVASVAHLPLAVRVPGEGLRLIEGEHTGDLGTGSVPMATAHDTLPRGSVLIFLSDSLLGGRSTFGMNGLSQLVPRWSALPEDAPVERYAEFVEGEVSKMKWPRQPCYMVVRVG